ncbi:hypothetical protein [Rhizobium lentis]|uniref:hypothetical protein n=1 Tax=Rhizobium lentis TaxID=1138194 RepID=UPI001C829D9F|nr:hypothetical protein [Rhizobium lentis]MBX5112700.1 hypothetical protein [Rhizobium lentis]
MTDVMWSVAQIAERDKISKAAVSKAAKKLLEERPDTPVQRDSQGRIMLLSLAHYDHYRQRFVNPAKAKAEIRTSEPDAPTKPEDPSSSFDEARRQSEWLKLGRERIRHQEEIGQLLRRDRVDQALRTAGLEIQSVIKRLANRADDLALAVSKEGVHGARVLLRTIAFELGNEIADRLAKVSETAPRLDDLIGDEVE